MGYSTTQFPKNFWLPKISRKFGNKWVKFRLLDNSISHLINSFIQ